MEFHRIEFSGLEVFTGLLQGEFGHDNVDAVLFGEGFQSCSDIHIDSHDGVVHLSLGPDIADSHFSEIDAHSDLELGLANLPLTGIEPLDALDHLESGEHRLKTVIVVMNRSTEHSHDGISDVLVDDSVAIHDDVHHD